jgi:hypothetical protein
LKLNSQSSSPSTPSALSDAAANESNFFRRLARTASIFHANERARPVGYDWFTDKEVAGYEQSFPTVDASRIDDATWRDLGVKAYLKLIGAGSSIFGRQMMYAWLRRGAMPSDFSDSPLKSVSQAETDQVLVQTMATREKLRFIDVDVTQMLFHGQLACVPRWTKHLWLASVLGLAALLLIKGQFGVLGVCLAIAYLVVNAWTQIKLYKPLHGWKKRRDAVIAMLEALESFGEAGQRIPHRVLKDEAEFLPEARRLLAALKPTVFERSPMLAEYANLFVLYEYIRFRSNVEHFRDELPALRRAYELLSKCEARICLIEHLKSRSTFCWVKETSNRTLLAENLTNPLLEDALPLTLDLRSRGAFLTGKNGVGKSTFLRGLGLNILSGRAFGFCYCTRAELPLLPVWSSIQNEDSLEISESLYMAEMRRGEALLAVAEISNGAVFLLDEIFRGTNNIESVSVTAAVVSHLADRAMVVMSSHNLVLAPLLETRLEPLRIVRGASQSDALKLESGVIAETNGIEMMNDYDIPGSVRFNARVVHDWFAGYVTKPSSFPELL